MKKETKVWLELAKEDYVDMKIMKKEKRLRGAVLFAQQAVEKILKAYIAEYMSRTPIRTHYIEKLVSDAKLDLKEINNPEVELLSAAYTWVRYADLSNARLKNPKEVERLIVMGEKVYLWVKTKFKNN
ncbi:MAG: HEPN domain-containing protein [bacterium]|nr:HEPN domain-containing protein [bacterium]